MTRQSQDGSRHSAFGDWLRENPNLCSRAARLCIVDIDWCLHQFAERTQHGIHRELQNIMFVEEKTFEANITDNRAQHDTLSTVHQLLMKGCREGQPQRVKVQSKMTGRLVTVRCYGYHLLRFSGAGPLDSAWIEWDWKRITLQQLEQILRFELSPLTLKVRDERSHHGGMRQRDFGF